MDYEPAPIDTSRLTLGCEIHELVELLARNCHENWARLRTSQGWRYGPERDDARKRHPNLVPYDQLSESEKEYDRKTALETIKTLLAMGFTIQPPQGSLLSSGEIFTGSAEELTKELQLLTDPTKPDLALLQDLWRGHDPEAWSRNPRIYRLLGERILHLGEPLVAYDVVDEGVRSFPKDARLRQLLALALARSGAAAPANAVLAALYEEGHRDEETLGLLARTHKDLAREAADPAKSKRHLRQAYEFYTQAYTATGGYWSGINSASLALFLGEADRAVALAREITEQCRQKLNRLEEAKGDRFWLLATLGEAALLLGDWSGAEDWYGKAIEVGRGDWGSLQSTRRNARLLMQHLDRDPEWLDRLFRFPVVVVFSGHMIDQSQRKTPRFPPQLDQPVKDAIRQRLKKLNAGFGYASAACGSDILFHEVLLEMKCETHVVLPYKKAQFVKDSVDLVRGGDWIQRFERIISQAAEVQEVSGQRQLAGRVSYEYANLMLLGLASVRTRQLDTRLVPLAVWDGKSGDGPGGTTSTVGRWRKLGLNVEIIDSSEILNRECPQLVSQADASSEAVPPRTSEPTPEFVSEIRGLLFADVEGFSKLTEEEVPRFVQHFLGLVGKLAAESAHKALMGNTWGDGIYFVFPHVRDAGQFALELRDAVRSADWTKLGLPGLKLRIALHAGPVYSCTDPVTQRTNYVGTHVSRAARIEPITPTGQVYASEEFAALAAAEGEREFRCEYVGQTSLAKKYGTFRIFVVLRRQG